MTPQEMYDHLVETVKSYNPSAGFDQIHAAYEYAAAHHAGQNRACTDVAVLAHGSPAAQDSTHVDHGAILGTYSARISQSPLLFRLLIMLDA